jgi:hypothetical protein
MPGLIIRAAALVAVLCLALCRGACANEVGSEQEDRVTPSELGRSLRVGDIVFIHVSALPFEKVALATGSWTNHVGIVVDVSGHEPVIAESAFPLSRTTTLLRFLARSKQGRVAVKRLDRPLSDAERSAIVQAARERMGERYDTGFNLHSGGQFCSRFVREVLAEATGVEIGEVETFAALLQRHPETDRSFWRVWYFGRIPWSRETITPASVLDSSRLLTVFDGFARQDMKTRSREPG